MYEQDDFVYDSRRPIAPYAHTRPTTERDWIKRTLIGVAFAFMDGSGRWALLSLERAGRSSAPGNYP